MTGRASAIALRLRLGLIVTSIADGRRGPSGARTTARQRRTPRGPPSTRRSPVARTGRRGAAHPEREHRVHDLRGCGMSKVGDEGVRQREQRRGDDDPGEGLDRRTEERLLSERCRDRQTGDRGTREIRGREPGEEGRAPARTTVAASSRTRTRCARQADRGAHEDGEGDGDRRRHREGEGSAGREDDQRAPQHPGSARPRRIWRWSGRS